MCFCVKWSHWDMKVVTNDILKASCTSFLSSINKVHIKSKVVIRVNYVMKIVTIAPPSSYERVCNGYLDMLEMI